MTTVNELIQDSLEIVGIHSPHEDLTTQWKAIGLRRINSILDGWNVDKMKGNSINEEEFVLTPAKQEYTIGVGGDLDTVRPVRIESAHTTDFSGVVYPINIIDFEEFDLITYPDVNNTFPAVMFYNPTAPLGTIKFYPIPAAGYTLHIDTWQGFAPYADGTDTVSVPQGYERLLTYQLAVEICSHIRKPAPADVRVIYNEIKNNIGAINFETWSTKTVTSTPTSGMIPTPNRTFLSRGI